MIVNEQSVNLKGGLTMLRSEWRYLMQHKMMVVVLVAIALIPAIYCFIYLSSMWDTYGKMDQLPVAIVDHDRPVTYHGKKIAIGQQLTANLTKSTALDFHHVSASTATNRLHRGTYYMVLTIPRNFSKKATTLLTTTPETMPLYFRFNSGQNFIVSKMTTGAATAIKSKVASQVTKLYAGIVLTALHQADTGMTKAATGGQTLTTGAQQLTTGTAQLSTGLNRLATGLRQATKSQGQPNQAVASLNTGVTQLTTAATALAAGSQQLQNGSQTLANQLTIGSQKLASIQTGANNAAALAAPVREVTSDVAKIPNNGTGMAPFAIAIGLYVGGIALGTMYEGFLPHRKPRYALSWWASKASVIGTVGLLQAGLLDISLLAGNHLHVSDHGLFFIAILLGSWLFLSLIFCLRLLLGGFGTWLVSIVLVLQLAGSGGLYPTYLVNGFAKAINEWLPMTYLIDALRSLIATHQAIGTDMAIMIGLIGLFNLLMLFRFQIGLHQSFIEIDATEDA